MNKRLEKKKLQRTLPVQIHGKDYDEMTETEKRKYDAFVQNNAICDTHEEFQRRSKEEQPITYRTRKPSKLFSV